MTETSPSPAAATTLRSIGAALAAQDGHATDVSALGDVPSAAKGDLSEEGVLLTVVQIIEDATGIESEGITPYSDLEGDLGIDSLSKIDIAVHLEDKFGIRVEDADVSSSQTPGDLMRMVRSKLATA